MKRILFLVFLVAGFIGARGQSNVYLRGDSIIIMKNGGFAELVIRNSTKDSGIGYVLTNIGNGVARWRPASGGGGGGGSQSWDQTLNVGASNLGKTLLFDTAYTISSSGAGSHSAMRFKPIRQGDGTPDFYFNFGAQRYSGVSQADNIWNMGWNLTGGGGQATAGQPGIGYQLEQRYIPVAGDTNTEAHLFYITVGGSQKRLYSYTVKEYLQTVDLYTTNDTWSMRRFDNDSIWVSAGYKAINFNYQGDQFSLFGDLDGVHIQKNFYSAYQTSYFGSTFSVINFETAKLPQSVQIGGDHSASQTLQFFDSTHVGGNPLFSIDVHDDRTDMSTLNGSNLPLNISLGSSGLAWKFATDHNYTPHPVLINPSGGVNVANLDVRDAVGQFDTNIYSDISGGAFTSKWAGTFSASGGTNNYGIEPIASGGSGINASIRITSPTKGANNWAILGISGASSMFNGSIVTGGNNPGHEIFQFDNYGAMGLVSDSIPTVAASTAFLSYLVMDNTGGGFTLKQVQKVDAPFYSSATLDFGSTAAGAVSDLTVTVSGAAVGDIVSLGVPNGSVTTEGVFFAWVSASNTVTVRFANNKTSGSLDPSSGTFKISVVHP